MIVTTTHSVDGRQITSYKGIVFGEVISGVDMFKDFAAGICNLVGGRSKSYENELLAARNNAIDEMCQRAAALGAHAVVGVDVDYETLGNGGMLMVTASGTAVTLSNM
ncbi:heavy metal-binding domain-containing protein [Collinsella vaginalis]|uniref:heavy metal-binding domain-containing protein n=1 Tax=Collinsella vaginalis TaxID=1870987 RepID=UPI000A2723C4|nr:heavy metal-binding domain-containing protein [Collinsella vaginalis]